MTWTDKVTTGARRTTEVVDDIAMDWAVRFDGDMLTADQQEILSAWLVDDERHLGAYTRALALLAHARRAKALGPRFAEVMDYDETSRSDAICADIPPPGRLAATGLRRRSVLKGVAAAGAGAVMGYAFLSPSEEVYARTYRTARGKTLDLSLHGGGRATLNTASWLEERRTGDSCVMTLREGEACFTIAGSSSTPTIKAGRTILTSSGGVFDLTRTNDTFATVLVTDGSVELGRQGIEGTMRIGKNSLSTIFDYGKVQTRILDSGEAARLLSWRKGLLVFEDTPLDQAVTQFARYGEMHIALAPALLNETITGRFQSSDPKTFIEAISLALDLKVSPTVDGVYLQKR